MIFVFFYKTEKKYAILCNVAQGWVDERGVRVFTKMQTEKQ